MSETTLKHHRHTAGSVHTERSLPSPRSAAHSFRLHVGLCFIVLMGCGTLLVAVPFAARNHPLLWLTLLPAAWGTFRAVFTLRALNTARDRAARVRRVLLRGVPVVGYVVSDTTSQNANPSCLVLMSFQPEVNNDEGYMRWLAQRIRQTQIATPRTADDRYVASLTDPEDRPVLYRRRKLPLSFTDGSIIFCADLFGSLPKTETVPCVAELGDMGGIEPVPVSPETRATPLSLLTDKQQA